MLEYIIELRARLMRCLLWFGFCFVICFYFANPLYLFVVKPLFTRLPQSSHFIATNVTASILTPLQLALQSACLLSLPLFLWQIWAFMAPGLYRDERRTFLTLMLFSIILFVVGVGFGYFLVLPVLFGFFISALPKGIVLLPDIRQTLDFTLWMLVVFGLCFQVPLVCAFLVRANILNVSMLVTARPYMVVVFFVMGMLLTPPDVVSQILVALPLCVLYETGIFLAKRIWVQPRSMR